MKYYKDTLNNLFAYANDGSQDSYIPNVLILITQAEADAIRNVPKTALQIRAALAPLSAWQVRKVLTQFNFRTQVENAIAGARCISQQYRRHHHRRRISRTGNHRQRLHGGRQILRHDQR